MDHVASERVMWKCDDIVCTREKAALHATGEEHRGMDTVCQNTSPSSISASKPDVPFLTAPRTERSCRVKVHCICKRFVRDEMEMSSVSLRESWSNGRGQP